MTQRICRPRMLCRHLLRPLSSPPSPKSATLQTIPGETGSHDPGCCNDEVFTSVAIVIIVVAAAVPLGVTVAGEKLHVEFAGSPLHAKLTAWLKPPLGVTDTLIAADAPAVTLAVDGETPTVKSPVAPEVTVRVTAVEVDALKFVAPP